jgi:aldehyde:ferredoxin oxidoreductase
MVEEYYQCRGWDRKTGLPKRDKLADLDLNDVVDELQNIGKLAS